MDLYPIKKNHTRTKYRGMHIDTLNTVQWKPRVYDDPFRFDFDTVKERIEARYKEGYTDDVATIKRNIKTVMRDNPGLFDNFEVLLEI